MIGLWMERHATDEHLSNIANAPRDASAWIDGDFVAYDRTAAAVAGCLIGHACGLNHEAAAWLHKESLDTHTDVYGVMITFDDGFVRWGQRFVDAIQDRARRILAARALSRMDGPREIVAAS